MTAITPTKEPGWYTHPNDPIRVERWWDGFSWADLTREAETKAVWVSGTKKIEVTFKPGYRALEKGLDTAAATVRPFGRARQNDSDDFVEERFTSHETHEARRLAAGPINENLLPQDRHPLNPDSVVARAAAADAAVHRRQRAVQLKATQKRRKQAKRKPITRMQIVIYVGICVVLALSGVFILPNLKPDQTINNAFDSFAPRATNTPQAVRSMQDPLGAVVILTPTTASSATTVSSATPTTTKASTTEALAALRATPGTTVFTSTDMSFRFLVENNWKTPEQTSDRVIRWETGSSNGIFKDLVSAASVPRPASAADADILQTHLDEIAFGGGVIAEQQLVGLAGAQTGTLLHVRTGEPSNPSSQYIDLVVSGNTHTLTLRWATFSKTTFEAQRGTIEQLFRSASVV